MGQAHAAALAEPGRVSLAGLSCCGPAQAASPACRTVSSGANERRRQIGTARRPRHRFRLLTFLADSIKSSTLGGLISVNEVFAGLLVMHKLFRLSCTSCSESVMRKSVPRALIFVGIGCTLVAAVLLRAEAVNRRQLAALAAVHRHGGRTGTFFLPECTLRAILLDNAPLGDDDIEQLTPSIIALSGYGYLSLASTGLSDAGLQFVSEIPQLRYLDISNTRLNGRGFEHLRNSKSLEYLVARNTEVDDAAIATLALVPTLRGIDIADTHVTVDGIRMLKQRRPLVTIQSTCPTAGRATGPTATSTRHAPPCRCARQSPSKAISPSRVDSQFACIEFLLAAMETVVR